MCSPYLGVHTGCIELPSNFLSNIDGTAPGLSFSLFCSPNDLLSELLGSKSSLAK